MRFNALKGEHLRSTNRALTTLPAALPDSIGQLEALKTLSLLNNQIKGGHLCVVPIVHPSPHALVPAALPSTIGDLKALEYLDVGNNALTGMCFCSTNRALTTLSSALPESIGQLQALKELHLYKNSLTGEQSRSTNRASDPSRTRACRAAVHDRQFEGTPDPQSGRQRPDRYVLL